MNLFPTNLAPFEFEKKLMDGGFKYIAGVDEVGRGALAGPVVAAAGIFQDPPKELKENVKDSKKCTPEKRETLLPIIGFHALSIGIGIVEPSVIDEINILQATFQAMTIALSQLSPQPHLCLVDGHQKIPIQIPQKSIVKGDLR